MPITQDPDTKLVTIEINEFKFFVVDDRAVLSLLALLSERDIGFSDKVGQRFYISEHGDILIKSIDPWFNPNRNFGDKISTAAELSILMEPYCARWLK